MFAAAMKTCVYVWRLRFSHGSRYDGTKVNIQNTCEPHECVQRGNAQAPFHVAHHLPRQSSSFAQTGHRKVLDEAFLTESVRHTGANLLN